MERTDRNGELRLKDVGRKVTLLGWVSTRRNLGSLLFIDLRDSSGIVQLIAEDPSKIPDVRNEYVVQAFGTVRKKDVPNPNLPTGEVEVVLDKLVVINKAETTPFIIADKTDALEDTRLQYRYLDLRRPIMQKRLKTRAKIVRTIHEFLDNENFTEIETPILNLATPEGARDYIVPSRLHHGRFYALPQSPQLFKQLLMIGGMERYYQIAKCFRDEDLRADRQPEFTQVDMEMSFLDQDQILGIMERLLAKIFKETVNYDVPLPLRRMKYWDAMDTYGSDKPDTRYGLTLKDVKAIMAKSSFAGFEGQEYIKAIVIPGKGKETSRKKMDELNVEARKFGLKGVMNLKVENGLLAGSFIKFMDEGLQKELMAALELKEDDLVLFASSAYRRDIDFGLGALRTKFAKEMGLIKEGTYDLLWVVDFPMFDPIEGQPGCYTAEHHPFTRPRDEDLKLLDTKPEEVLAYAYDIIINGYEAGGGTLRIYDHDIQWKIFKILGLSDEDVARKFGWFIDAFKYGCPPHGGIAFGLDRLCMILTGTDNIRDVEAFPKNLQAVDPMSKAPGEVSQEAMDCVGIELKKE
ncbi:MAG: aspartate--tRNA ligase [Candidatus Enteromonas sp.]|jgi:aspartyl-tRNA synthetase|nr:aspartate--tRNA ligase [Bacilli bacterium]MEE3426861.1 aspartate--tRNA ligase [Candidatus Enteromonas sp.]